MPPPTVGRLEAEARPACDGRGATDGDPVVAVVVVGRNEAQHLEACLRSVLAETSRVVYADSASDDGSLEIARRLGVQTVQIHATTRLSAARGRNEGFRAVSELWPDASLVQFVDGDCRLIAGWIEIAKSRLLAQPHVAVVCGRVHEQERDRSVYARLCDMEFHREPGDVASCGGIFMVRAAEFRSVGGFDPSVVAGEEPELCLRLRARGRRVVRLPDSMAWHDSGITNFRQWWRRTVRSGGAYAQAVLLHGSGPSRFGVRESLSIWFWAIVFPLALLASAPFTSGWSLAAGIVYPLQAVRIARARRRPGETRSDARLYAVACVVAKWPQWIGQVGMLLGRLRRRRDIGRAGDPAPTGEPGGEPHVAVPSKPGSATGA